MTGGEQGPTPHAQPFFCPYCGEEDFVPYGEDKGGYRCNSCSRHFVLKFAGLSVRDPAGSDGSRGSSTEVSDAV